MGFIISEEIQWSIENSVLCWLATADKQGVPNVSPKEVFCKYDSTNIIIANIASPKSVKNIEENPKVCLSFIDVFVQKGFQLKGDARIVHRAEKGYSQMMALLEKITEGRYPIKSIIEIELKKARPIIAPSYILYPEIPLEERIEMAKRRYKL